MRPRLAWRFTIVAKPDAVWLVAGEDVRYTLRGAGVWLAELLARCDGTRTTDELVAGLPNAAEAREMLADLAGERIVVDGTASDAHRPAPATWRVEGRGPLVERLGHAEGEIHVHVEDRQDLDAAMAANRAHRAAGHRWMWVSTGAQARAFVGPLFLPDAGPCLQCLLDHFYLRSPAPEVYDVLIEHARAGGDIAAAELAEPALDIVAALVKTKLSLVEAPLPPAALYALHVVELASLEVSSHAVFRNPECPACR